jgi:hypothetical protein
MPQRPPPSVRRSIPRWIPILLLLSAAALAQATCNPNLFGAGDGTAGNPFRITSPLHLENLRDTLGTADEACITGTYHYRQTRNLDFSGRDVWTHGIGFGMEGLEEFYGPYRPFRGHYDGRGFTIANFTLLQTFDALESSANHMLGIFGSADAATFTDIVITNARIEGRRQMGALLGFGQAVTIRDVTVSGAMKSSYGDTSGESLVGLLAGELVGASLVEDAVTSGAVEGSRLVGGAIGRIDASRVENASSSAAVTGNVDVGGLIGYALNASSLESVSASGDVTKLLFENNARVGGLLGYLADSTLTDASASGDVTATEGGYVGGLIGYARGTSSDSRSVIIDVTASGDVIGGRERVGGLVGFADRVDILGVDIVVTASGSVTGTERVGGLVGQFGFSSGATYTIERASATGDVTGTATRVGGFIGFLEGDCQYPVIRDVDASGSVTGTNDVGGLVGFTVANCTVTISDARRGAVPVTGTDDVGGLLGEAIGEVIVSRSYSLSDVTGTGSRVGGLIGGAGNISGGSITASYAAGDVAGSASYVGGLIGRWGEGTVANAYAEGAVTTAANAQYVGGLIGAAEGGTLRSSYAIGVVAPGSGSTDVGGLVGSFGGTAEPPTSFWDAETTTVASSAVGSSLDATQARTFATFDDAGWAIVTDADPDDFHPTDLVWVLCDGTNPAEGAPKLAWQEERSLCRPALALAVVGGPNVLQNVPFTLELTLLDPQGNPFDAESTITLALTGAGGSVAGELLRDGRPATATIPRGTATLLLRDVVYTGAGTNVTLTATSDGIAGGEATTVIDVGATTFTLTVDTTSLPADGTSIARFVASLRDAAGAGIPGVPITVSTTRGTLFDAKGLDRGGRSVETTDPTGAVNVRLRASTTPGDARVRFACPGSCRPEVTVTFYDDAPPQGITLTPGDRSIRVAFAPPAGVTLRDVEFRIWPQGSDASTEWTARGSIRSPFTLDGLTNGVTYLIQLRAIGAAGISRPSEALAATPFGVSPDAAAIVTLQPGDRTLRVSYALPTSIPVAGVEYRLWPSGETAPETWSTPSTRDNPFLVTGLTNGVTYAVQIRAIAADPTAAPGAASDVATATVGPLTVTLQPSEVFLPADGATERRIEATFRDASGAPIPRLPLVITATAAVLVAAAGPTDTLPIATNAAGVAHFTVRALATPGIVGVTLTCADDACRTDLPLEIVTRLTAAPSGLRAIPGNARAWLIVDPASSEVTGYQVRIDTQPWRDVAGMNSPLAITGLTNGVPVTLRVRAVTRDGPTAPTAAVTITPNPVTPVAATISVETPANALEVPITAGVALLQLPYRFTNTGSGPITSIWLHDIGLRPGERLLAITPSIGTITRIGDRWFWTDFTVAPGANLPGTLTIEITAP